MTTEITGQLGRSVNALTKKSSQTSLPGTIRKKYPGTGYSGTGSILTSLKAGQLSSGSIASPDGSAGTRIAQSLAGTIRKSVSPQVSDSQPISASKKTEKSPVTIPATYETGGILESIKSGLTTYLPAILVIGSVILGIVIIKSAGGSGGRRR